MLATPIAQYAPSGAVQLSQRTNSSAEFHTLAGSTPPDEVAPTVDLGGVPPAFAQLVARYERVCTAFETLLARAKEGTALIEAGTAAPAQIETLAGVKREILRTEPLEEEALFALYDCEPATWAELAILGRILRERNGVARDGSTRGISTETYVDFARHAERLGMQSFPGATPLGVIGLCAAETDAELIALGRALELAWRAEQVAGSLPDDAPDQPLAAAIDRTSAIVDRIGQMPARTATGLAIKLRAYQWAQSSAGPDETPLEGATVDDRLLASACRDAATLVAGTTGEPLDADAELIALGAELNRLWAEASVDEDDDAAERLAERSAAVANKIRSLKPATLAGVRVKARAVAWVHNGDIWEDTDPGERAIRNLLRDLGALDDLPDTAERSPIVARAA